MSFENHGGRGGDGGDGGDSRSSDSAARLLAPTDKEMQAAFKRTASLEAVTLTLDCTIPPELYGQYAQAVPDAKTGGSSDQSSSDTSQSTHADAQSKAELNRSEAANPVTDSILPAGTGESSGRSFTAVDIYGKENILLAEAPDQTINNQDEIVRNKYDTSDEAARGAFQEIYLTSQLQDTEYGARIYYDSVSKKYGYTIPQHFARPDEAGYHDNLEPLTHAPISAAPTGTIPIARLHTHVKDDGSDYGYKSLYPSSKSVAAIVLNGDPGDLFNDNPNRFSPNDITNAKNEHQASYLATPDGTIFRYDDKIGKIYKIGTVDK